MDILLTYKLWNKLAFPHINFICSAFVVLMLRIFQVLCKPLLFGWMKVNMLTNVLIAHKNRHHCCYELIHLVWILRSWGQCCLDYLFDYDLSLLNILQRLNTSVILNFCYVIVTVFSSLTFANWLHLYCDFSFFFFSHKTQAYMRLAELFPKGSPDPTDENFVPSWFLVEKHRNTSFAQLKVCQIVKFILNLLNPFIHSISPYDS